MRHILIFAWFVLASAAFGQWTATKFDDGNGFLEIDAHAGNGLGGSYNGVAAFWPDGTPASVTLFASLGNTGVIAAMTPTLQIGETRTSGGEWDAFMW